MHREISKCPITSFEYIAHNAVGLRLTVEYCTKLDVAGRGLLKVLISANTVQGIIVEYRKDTRSNENMFLVTPRSFMV